MKKDRDFIQIFPRKDLCVGIDFRTHSDFAVETIMEKSNGSVRIISSNIIGRASDFNTKEKRNKYLKRYENS